jgi:hypothetical protein
MTKKILLFLLAASFLPLYVFAQGLDIDADTAVFYLYAGKDNTALCETVTTYLRTAVLFMGYKIHPIPYVLKVMEWAGVNKNQDLSYEEVLKMGQKLEAKNIIYGSVAKSGSTYTVSLNWLDGAGNTINSGESSGKGEYSISTSIDKLLGLLE